MKQGIITPSTKERLEELEQERTDLEGQIAYEEIRKPLLSKERMCIGSILSRGAILEISNTSGG